MSPESFQWLDVQHRGGLMFCGFTTRSLTDPRVLQEVGEELRRAVAAPAGQVFIDFSAVTQVGSALLAQLIDLNNSLRASGGRLVLCGLRPEVRNLFTVTQADQMLTIREDDAAVPLR